jgi:hypothetical protein
LDADGGALAASAVVDASPAVPPPAQAVGDIAARAEARFARLRAEARAGLAGGATARRLAAEAGDVPAGWCVSTIARLVVNDPGALPAVADCQARLRAAGPATPYSAESLHLSLLGATQREPSPEFPAARVGAIADAARSTLAGVPAVAVRLGRLNLLGAQWFVEAIPVDGTWATLRRELAAAFEAVGEAPIAYADTEPMHLNVARLDRLDDPAVGESLLADPPDVGHWLTLNTVELVVTDFLVSPATLRVLDTLALG